MGVRRSLSAIFALGMVDIFTVSTVKIYWALVRKVAAEQSRRVPVAKVRLTFGKSGYLMGDTFRQYVMLIRILNSSESHRNVKEEIRVYL